MKTQRWGYLAIITLTTNLSHAATAFFDEDPATRFAPIYKGTSAIDKEVLALCGDWGSQINSSALKAFFRGQSTILERVNRQPNIRQMTFEQWFGSWTERHAFSHIFCGEPSTKKLGGLHFAPRFKQAQDQGWATMCRSDKPCTDHKHAAIAEQGIYSVPVWYRIPNSERFNKKPVSGYNLEMSADEILYEATLAFAHYSKQISGKKSCIFSVFGNQHYPQHKAVAAMTPTALITFYSAGPGGVQHSINRYGSARSCR